MDLAVDADVFWVTKDNFERMVQSVTVGFVSLVAELDFKVQDVARSFLWIDRLDGLVFFSLKSYPFLWRRHSFLQPLHEFVSVFPALL